MEKVDVNLIGDELGSKTLIIREGEALKERESERLNITGDIRSVGHFIANRRNVAHEHQLVTPGISIVIANKDGGSIHLLTNPNSYYGSVVTGKLELSEALKAFRINEKGTMSQKDVVDILKFNKVHFRDRAAQESLLRAYQAFSFKTATDGKNEADIRGNKTQSFNKTVTTDLPDDFVLRIPIYKGEDVKEFRVEIGLDVTDGSARFWFESTELHELLEIEKEIIFARELENCKGLVVIYK